MANGFSKRWQMMQQSLPLHADGVLKRGCGVAYILLREYICCANSSVEAHGGGWENEEKALTVSSCRSSSIASSSSVPSELERSTIVTIRYSHTRTAGAYSHFPSSRTAYEKAHGARQTSGEKRRERVKSVK
ncbi:tissue inhibitor of metalloproteinase [Anopheles sinensis]|uniref:Tissue inhibitor of metalloproteinase n=1 Tax=Anopheles sinensis TaxID=74873 RepID=A0A084W2C0_ANOSI|nr:tissue inhibitor of metalloproteinase [Anopheles sinensis]